MCTCLLWTSECTCADDRKARMYWCSKRWQPGWRTGRNKWEERKRRRTLNSGRINFIDSWFWPIRKRGKEGRLVPWFWELETCPYYAVIHSNTWSMASQNSSTLPQWKAMNARRTGRHCNSPEPRNDKPEGQLIRYKTTQGSFWKDETHYILQERGCAKGRWHRASLLCIPSNWAETDDLIMPKP